MLEKAKQATDRATEQMKMNERTVVNNKKVCVLAVVLVTNARK